jgi:hypothetical protein
VPFDAVQLLLRADTATLELAEAGNLLDQATVGLASST